MRLLKDWIVMTCNWLRNQPPRPDPLGQEANERALEETIRELNAHTDRVFANLARRDPDLAARVEAAARQRKIELERDLIVRRQRHQREAS
jgi:hypothetical protein